MPKANVLNLAMSAPYTEPPLMTGSTHHLEEFVQLLVAGDRIVCRELIDRELTACGHADRVYRDLLWPALEKIDKLYRTDRINAAVEHMATRIARSIADQLQVHLVVREPNGKTVLISCADGEPEELGAQMTADLFEARGWKVYFVGGGVPSDEILGLVGELMPNLLLVFGTQPSGVPGVRRLVDMVRDIGVNPTMNIMVSGGVFNRADGLWREVNSDLFARTATEALELAEASEPRTPTLKVNGTPKKRRRRRRQVAAVGA